MTGGELTLQRVQITACWCVFLLLDGGFFRLGGVALKLSFVVENHFGLKSQQASFTALIC